MKEQINDALLAKRAKVRDRLDNLEDLRDRGYAVSLGDLAVVDAALSVWDDAIKTANSVPDPQAIAGRWSRTCFGDEVTMDRKERALRVLEEAIELAQAEGIEINQASNLVGYVYSRPPGEPAQELGGVRLTCLVYAVAAGLSADVAERVELERVLAKDPEVFRQRNREKTAAGVGRVP